MSFAITAIATFTTFKMISTYQSGKAQTKALKQEAEIKSREQAKKTKLLAASQKASFLSSGIALNGVEDGPGQFIQETYDTGLEDINLLRENYKSKIKNVWGQTRSKMLSDFSEGVMMGMGSGGFGGGKPAIPGQGGYGLNTPSGVVDTGSYSDIRGVSFK